MRRDPLDGVWLQGGIFGLACDDKSACFFFFLVLGAREIKLLPYTTLFPSGRGIGDGGSAYGKQISWIVTARKYYSGTVVAGSRRSPRDER